MPTTITNGNVLIIEAVYNGTDGNWQVIGVSSQETANQRVTTGATQTLTNKTISGSSNTITNISNLSVTRQADTTSSTANGTRVETGIGRIGGNGTNDISETVTFGTAFLLRL